MKKLLLAALATLLAMPAMAATIFASEDGKNKVDIYGNLRAVMGYGFFNGGTYTESYSSTPTSATSEGKPNHQFNYGLQGNSQLGFNAKLGAFFGQIEFGANEQTTINSGTGVIGLRQAWASWAIAGHADKYGNLSFGKMNTPTSMGGYITTGWDADGSLLGYGGSASSQRNFQIQYAIKGVQIALIEKHHKDLRDISVRPAIAFNFGGKGLKGKVGLTGALSQSGVKNDDGTWKEGVAAFGVTFGIRKQFNDLFALAFIARVGLNENRYGEAGDVYDDGKWTSAKDGTDGFRVGVAFDFGLTPNKFLGINIGVGYQASLDLGALTPNTDLAGYRDIAGFSTFGLKNAIAVYVRLPLKLDAHWQLIPEVGTHINMNMGSIVTPTNTTSISDNKISAYLALQMVSTF